MGYILRVQSSTREQRLNFKDLVSFKDLGFKPVVATGRSPCTKPDGMSVGAAPDLPLALPIHFASDCSNKLTKIRPIKIFAFLQPPTAIAKTFEQATDFTKIKAGSRTAQQNPPWHLPIRPQQLVRHNSASTKIASRHCVGSSQAREC